MGRTPSRLFHRQMEQVGVKAIQYRLYVYPSMSENGIFDSEVSHVTLFLRRVNKRFWDSDVPPDPLFFR